jgi:hypothetical protein
MDRLGGPAGGIAAFALTAGLAADTGGFGAVSWDRALIGLCAAALLLVILGGGERPGGRYALVFLGALGSLTAWTAASWLWSDSPPLALVEAQRVALYFAIAIACVLAGRRLSLQWLAGGIAVASTFIAIWNLAIRIGGHSHPSDLGASARPVGYANSLALICVVGLLLLPVLPRLALVLAGPLVADLVLQKSAGALAGLAAGALVYAFVAHPRARRAVIVLAVCGAAASPFALKGHFRAQYWHVAVHEARAEPVLGSGAGTFRDWWLRDRSEPASTLEAHSLYLETLAELAPIGLALLLVALATPVCAAARLGEPAIAAAIAAYDCAASVDFHWELAGVTAPVVLIGAAAVVRVGRRRIAHVRPLPAAIALAALTVAALLAYAGSVRLQEAQAALAAGNAPRAASLARAALRYAPFSTDAWQVIGDAERSAAAYRRGLALDKNDWTLWSRLASVTKGAPHRLALREAVRLNPLASGP